MHIVQTKFRTLESTKQPTDSLGTECDEQLRKTEQETTDQETALEKNSQ